MRSVEITIQKLISSGLDPKLENNPYLCFVYTSFQVTAASCKSCTRNTLKSCHCRSGPPRSPTATPEDWPRNTEMSFSARYAGSLRLAALPHWHTRVCGMAGAQIRMVFLGLDLQADEARHEAAYTRIMEQVFARDPEGAVLAFADMMKKVLKYGRETGTILIMLITEPISNLPLTSTLFLLIK